MTIPANIIGINGLYAIDRLRSKSYEDGRMLIPRSLLGCRDEPRRVAHGID